MYFDLPEDVLRDVILFIHFLILIYTDSGLISAGGNVSMYLTQAVSVNLEVLVVQRSSGENQEGEKHYSTINIPNSKNKPGALYVFMNRISPLLINSNNE